MDQLPEGTFITAERVGEIEVHLTLPADRTKVVFVQWIRIYKGRPAGSAEEFSPQGLRRGKAIGTDRDPRDLGQRFRTDAALIRENYVKKCRRNASDAGPERERLG